MKMITKEIFPDIKYLSTKEIYQTIHRSKVINRHQILSSLLEESFVRFYNRIALVDDEQITYQKLDEFSNDVADYIESNFSNEKYILVYAKRNWKTVAIICGILKSGKAYVPISIDIPQKRLERIKLCTLSDVLLTEDMDFKNSLRRSTVKIVNEQDPAYVIFTSGSTGEPKGVEIPNISVADTMQTASRLFGLNEYDVVLGISALTFDLSIFDLFSTLSVGGKLVIVKDNQNPALMHEKIKEEKVTTINTVAGAFSLLLDYSTRTGQLTDLTSLRTVVLSGDVVPARLVDNILENLPQTNLHIMGGPTEITVWSNDYLYETRNQKYSYVPYGLPIANKTMYVMKNHNAIIEEEGEIVSGGIGLATGYIGDDELTSKKFWLHPDYGRLYNTGDLGIFTSDGLIKICGRVDNQVKINGFRVELEEIERHINDIPEVVQSIVGVVTESNVAKLVAGVKISSSINSNQIVSELEKNLPEYEIPSSFFELESIPLSANQKLDRKAFRRMMESSDSLKRL